MMTAAVQTAAGPLAAVDETSRHRLNNARQGAEAIKGTQRIAHGHHSSTTGFSVCQSAPDPTPTKYSVIRHRKRTVQQNGTGTASGAGTCMERAEGRESNNDRLTRRVATRRFFCAINQHTAGVTLTFMISNLGKCTQS